MKKTLAIILCSIITSSAFAMIEDRTNVKVIEHENCEVRLTTNVLIPGEKDFSKAIEILKEKGFKEDTGSTDNVLFLDAKSNSVHNLAGGYVTKGWTSMSDADDNIYAYKDIIKYSTNKWSLEADNSVLSKIMEKGAKLSPKCVIKKL